MTVDTPERAWTDERLDHLSKKVEDGFAKVDTDIRELRGEMKAGFDKADAKMDTGFARVDQKFVETHEKMDARFAGADRKMDVGFAKVDSRFDRIEKKVDADIREVRSSMNRLLVALLAVGGGIIAALLKSHGL
jgi:tetrahydromethanopterin S-methyltransferase subunit G